MSKQELQLFAAIHLGSEQISIQIVEYSNLASIRIIDQASQQVSLGEETFKTGRISFASVSEVCEVLRGYRRLIDDYGVRDFRVVGTTAIREAQNQHYIVDQIKIKTGFSIEVIDMPQEIFYKYASIIKTAEQNNLLHTEQGIFFVDISSGGLGMTLVQNGEIKYQQNIHIGVIRIKESFDNKQQDSAYFNQALVQYIASIIAPVKQEMDKYKIKYLVLSGAETKLLLKMIGNQVGENLIYIDVQEFYNLYEQIRCLNMPQLIKKYCLTEDMGEMVLPTITLHHEILSLISVESIVIPPDRFIDGMTILYVGARCKDSWLDKLDSYIISLVKAVARKYSYEEGHSHAVEKYSLMLYDKLVKAHGLGKRERLLLQIATILHDIGKFVSLRQHYFYSYRLILSSDIFGITDQEKKIVAFIAHYHSKGIPRQGDREFDSLTIEQQVIVGKLAAIVRLADAMDRGHRQKITKCRIYLKGDDILIKVNTVEDLSLEEWTFIDKAAFFEEVYGIKAVLERTVRQINV